MMYDELEQALVRELDDVASHVVVAERPPLPALTPDRSRWRSAAPLLAAAAVVAVLATVATLLVSGGPDRTTPSRPPPPRPPPTLRPRTRKGVSRWPSPWTSTSAASRCRVGGTTPRGRATAGSASATTAAGGGATTCSRSSSRARWSNRRPSPRTAATWRVSSAREAARC